MEEAAKSVDSAGWYRHPIQEGFIWCLGQGALPVDLRDRTGRRKDGKFSRVASDVSAEFRDKVARRTGFRCHRTRSDSAFASQCAGERIERCKSIVRYPVATTLSACVSSQSDSSETKSESGSSALPAARLRYISWRRSPLPDRDMTPDRCYGPQPNPRKKGASG